MKKTSLNHTATQATLKSLAGLKNIHHQALIKKITPLFQTLLSKEGIPPSQYFKNSLEKFYLPLCNTLSDQQTDKPLVIGINGAQGTGKSTLSKILNLIFTQGFNKSLVSFSLDDLYKTKTERKILAKNIHPLLATRGVPGTHDTELGISILAHLSQRISTECLIPTFDKSIDDRTATSNWQNIKNTCDIIIFEGWCVGSQPQNDRDLELAINELEKEHDKDKIWRHYVNQQLKVNYKELFSFIDVLIMLKIPSFEKTYEWRNIQEVKLKNSIENCSTQNTKFMNKSEIKNFIMHFERISRHALEEMPARADIVVELDDNQNIKNITSRL